MSNNENCLADGVDDIAVNAGFVTALAEDYAKHGRVAIDRMFDEEPARFIMVIVSVLNDERYADEFEAAFTEARQHRVVQHA